jgi:hypothetical protein
MDPITLALIGTGALKAGAGIAQGIGTARAGKKLMLSEVEKKELAELEKRQRTGQLGLTEQENSKPPRFNRPQPVDCPAQSPGVNCSCKSRRRPSRRPA